MAASSKRRAQLRRSLAARDGKRCFYCTTAFVDLADATIDHLIPQSVLPGWRQFNLVLACHPCNSAKGDTLPQVFLRQIAEAHRHAEAARSVPWWTRLTRWVRRCLPLSALTPRSA
jgi:5-methylcytosine-specific restriction endonuclease McrA